MLKKDLIKENEDLNGIIAGLKMELGMYKERCDLHIFHAKTQDKCLLDLEKFYLAEIGNKEDPRTTENNLVITNTGLQDMMFLKHALSEVREQSDKCFQMLEEINNRFAGSIVDQLPETRLTPEPESATPL